MALTSDDLSQIREVVRAETQQQAASNKWKTIVIVSLVVLAPIIIFIAVLALHVMVIAGFTAYHLLNPSP